MASKFQLFSCFYYLTLGLQAPDTTTRHFYSGTEDHTQVFMLAGQDFTKRITSLVLEKSFFNNLVTSLSSTFYSRFPRKRWEPWRREELTLKRHQAGSPSWTSVYTHLIQSNWRQSRHVTHIYNVVTTHVSSYCLIILHAPNCFFKEKNSNIKDVF